MSEPRAGRCRARSTVLLPVLALLLGALFLFAAAPAAAQSDFPGEPRNVQVAVGDKSLRLTWQAPESWGNWPKSGYEIDYAVGDSAPMEASDDWDFVNDQSPQAGHAATSYTFSGIINDGTIRRHEVANGNKYHFRIRAVSKNPNPPMGEDGIWPGEWVTVSGTPQPSAPTTLTLTANDVMPTEGDTVTVTATLDQNAPTGGVGVTLTAGAGSTAGSSDYTLPMQFNISAGSRTATASVMITDDNVAETSETLALGATTAAGITVTGVTLTIQDNDTASTAVTLSLSPTSVAENAGQRTVTVTAALNNAARTQATTVSVTRTGGTATSGTDYGAISAVTVTIPAGQRSGTRTFSFSPTDDNVAEPDETVILTGMASNLTSGTATLTITDNDTASTALRLSLNPATVAENAGQTNVTVTAALNNAARAQATAVTVSRTGGTATSGTDYGAISTFTVTIPARQTSGTQTFSFNPTDDNVAEGSETVILTGTTTVASLSSDIATLTLTDDDTAATGLILSMSPGTVAENAGQRTVTVTASLNGAARTMSTTVNVSRSGGSATSGTDYRAIGTVTVTIPAGQTSGTRTFSFSPTNDNLAEGNETVILTGAASGLTSGTATLTITDDDSAASALILSLNPPTVAENAGQTNVTVTAALNGAARAGSTTVNVSRTGGSATSGTDYGTISAFTVTIPAGQTSGTQTFSFSPTDDNVAEGSETVILTGTASGLTPGTATLTITDDDTDGTPPDTDDPDDDTGSGGGPSTRSSDATLSALVVTGSDGEEVSLDSAFDPGNKGYTAALADCAVFIAPTASHRRARVSVAGETVGRGRTSAPIDLKVGETVIEIAVTAENGNVRTYVLTVTRVPPAADAPLPALVATGNDNACATRSPVFHPDTTDYTDASLPAPAATGNDDAGVPRSPVFHSGATDYAAGADHRSLPELGRALADDTQASLAARLEAGRRPLAPIPAGASPLTRLGQALGSILPGQSLSSADPSATAAFDPARADARVDSGWVTPAAPINWRALIDNADFVLPLSNTPANGEPLTGLRSLTLWSDGSYRNLSGHSEGLDWDGDLLGARLGAELRLSPSLTAGTAAGWQRAGWDTREGDNELRHTLTLIGVNPYAGWTHDRLHAWLSGGLGWGTLNSRRDESPDGESPHSESTYNESPHSESTYNESTHSEDATTRTLGGGIQGQLWHSAALDLRIKAEALLTGLDTETVTTNAHRLRLALTAGHTRHIGQAGALTPTLQLGLRHDGGHGQGGTGLELGGSLHYAGGPLTLRGQGRTLIGRDGYQEWGIQGLAEWRARADGRGLTLRLIPGYGAADSGIEQLWSRGLREDRITPAARNRTARLAAHLSYSWDAPWRRGQITPYLEMQLQHTTRVRSGLRWAAPGHLQLHLVGERNRDTTGAQADHALLLEGTWRF